MRTREREREREREKERGQRDCEKPCLQPLDPGRCPDPPAAPAHADRSRPAPTPYKVIGFYEKISGSERCCVGVVSEMNGRRTRAVRVLVYEEVSERGKAHTSSTEDPSSAVHLLATTTSELCRTKPLEEGKSAVCHYDFSVLYGEVRGSERENKSALCNHDFSVLYGEVRGRREKCGARTRSA